MVAIVLFLDATSEPNISAILSIVDYFQIDYRHKLFTMCSLRCSIYTNMRLADVTAKTLVGFMANSKLFHRCQSVPGPPFTSGILQVNFDLLPFLLSEKF